MKRTSSETAFWNPAVKSDRTNYQRCNNNKQSKGFMTRPPMLYLFSTVGGAASIELLLFDNDVGCKISAGEKFRTRDVRTEFSDYLPSRQI